jgi:hypothetical protein
MLLMPAALELFSWASWSAPADKRSINPGIFGNASATSAVRFHAPKAASVAADVRMDRA